MPGEPMPADPLAAPAAAAAPFPPPPTPDVFAPPAPSPPIAAPPTPVAPDAPFAASADAPAFPATPAPAWPGAAPAEMPRPPSPAPPTAAPMPGEVPAPVVASPSNPFAGPVDPQATAAMPVQDPFAPPPAEEPLAPPPLLPDPFAAPAPADAVAPGDTPTTAAEAVAPTLEPEPAPAPESAPTPAPPSNNGHGIVVDDPFAGPAAPPAPTPGQLGPPSDLGIQILDAILVDDPMADAPPAPPAPPAPAAPVEPDDELLPPVSDVEVLTPDAPESDPVVPTASPITWNAAAPASPTPPAPPTAERAGVDTGPRFERASAHWQVGGIFPATAMADDGTLALRRADARWALTDLSAPGDCVIEAAFDFRAGSGFGVVFRGSVADGERITGYSFDVDPIAGGGGYIVRLWEGSRQHWRPLAQAPVTDPAHLYGRHVVGITLRADQLTVVVDDDPVLELPALSRCTLELGREPCRGDRVGVQAWSTTEVTVESFRVANL
jgi:hypothetical protein